MMNRCNSQLTIAMALITCIGPLMATRPAQAIITVDRSTPPRFLTDTPLYPGQISVANGFAYFRVYGTGRYLPYWFTNGRPGGTRPLPYGEDIVVKPTALPNSNNILVFKASLGLCNLNPVSGDITMLRRTASPPISVELSSVNNRWLFFSEGHLWSTDGTLGGTVQLTSTGYLPEDYVILGTTALFVVIRGYAPSTYELWRTDGTPEGTSFLAPLSNRQLFDRNSSYAFFRKINDRVVFLQQHPDGTLSLWTSDGSVDGTHEVAPWTIGVTINMDLTPEGGCFMGIRPVSTAASELWNASADPEQCRVSLRFDRPRTFATLGVANGLSLFVEQTGYTASSTRTLWIADGTADRTLAVPGFPGPRLIRSSSQPFAIVGDNLYMAANLGNTGEEPWRLDLSTGTISLVKDVTTGPAGSTLLSFFPIDHARKFGFLTSSNGSQTLYLSNGAPDDTRAVATFSMINQQTIKAFGNRVLFSASQGRGGSSVYVIDLCPADYDNSTVVNSADLFAFLADWFAADADANFDNYGSTPNSADLFGFIEAWVNGCDD